MRLFKNQKLQDIIDLTNKDLLIEAFTHKTFAVEHNVRSYDRLEFIGDSVLDVFIACYLYDKYPDSDEQFLTERRIDFVSGLNLAKICKSYKLEKNVLLGEGLKKHPEQIPEKMYADIVESLIGAIYISLLTPKTREFLTIFLRLE